jgi:hypothetical protein
VLLPIRIRRYLFAEQLFCGIMTAVPSLLRIMKSHVFCVRPVFAAMGGGHLALRPWDNLPSLA